MSVTNKVIMLGCHSDERQCNKTCLPDTLVAHVSGLGHLGGVEHQVDVVLVETARLDRGRQ